MPYGKRTVICRREQFEYERKYCFAYLHIEEFKYAEAVYPLSWHRTRWHIIHCAAVINYYQKTQYILPLMLKTVSIFNYLLNDTLANSVTSSHAFFVASPTVWKSIPLLSFLSFYLKSFKRNLETFNFKSSFPPQPHLV